MRNRVLQVSVIFTLTFSVVCGQTPVASFAYDPSADTVWINSPNTFYNTSTFSTNSYWDIKSYSPTLNGTYTPFAATRKCAPQWNICYMDTSNRNFKYTFSQRGYYKVNLKVTNNASGSCNAYAMNYNGSTGYTATSAAIPALANSFTLEYWIKNLNNSALGSGYNRISALNGYAMETAIDHGTVVTAGTLKFYTGSWQITSVVLQLGVWTHIAWVINGGVVSLYKDGVLAWTGTTAVNLASQIWRFGQLYSGATTESANVQLDEIRIWNVARSATAIQSTMNTCIPAQTGLVGYWNMSNGSGNVITDGSSSGINLNMVNMTNADWVAGVPMGTPTTATADSIEKTVYVDTPSTVPKANFFVPRTKIGIGDYATMVDLSSNGPNQWYWTFTPGCNLCANPPYFNNFFAGPTDNNPIYFGGDPGKFTICLQVWNARGFDTICKTDYIEVLNSINICSGSGAASSSLPEGFMFAAAGPGLSYTRSQLSGCTGFLLNPCADSIYLFVDRIKMLPSDTLVIRNGSSASAPILAKLGAANVNQLSAGIINSGIRGGSRVFVHFQLGTQSVPVPYDSAGFAIRWAIKPASYGIPQSHIVIPDTIFSLQPTTYTNVSTGTFMQFSWDSDGNGIYDSTGASVTKNVLVTTPQFRKICLVTYNCLGSDTSCKTVMFLPTSVKPVVRFDVDKTQGFNTDTFRFTDKSLYGPGTWAWTITGGAYQTLMGTVKVGNVVISRDPIIRFTQRTKYTIKLVASNQYGTDSLTKVDYINIGAYDQPQCISDIILADGSIGISRVALQNGIDTAFNAYTPCFQLVAGLQQAKMYRGKKHVLTVVRPGTQSPMDRRAWIDFNMDGLFSNNEVVMNDMNNTTLSKTDTVFVNNTQILGNTRMRVAVSYAGTQLTSSVTFLGVFRDYNISFPNDTVKPSIALINAPTLYTEVHKAFVDPGVIASDNIEGYISSRFETIGFVDTSKVGPNYLKYIVRDLYGNISDTLYRTVFVILNQTGPTITLSGATSVYVEVYHKFNEPGFMARDNQGNDISNQVVITSNLDTSKLGLYGNIYTIVDAFGFSRTAGRGITVGDSTRPWLITPPNNIYVHQVGSAFDAGSIVIPKDNYWSAANLTLTWTGTVDVNNVGSYYLLYNIKDQSGNYGNEVVIEVRVKDTKPPVITLKGASVYELEVHTGYVEPGYTVSDNYWAPGTVSVSTKGSISNKVLGSYVIWYIATDPSGNKDSVSREIKVVDKTRPVVNLLNIFEVNLPRWKEYVDPPVALEDNYYTDAQLRPRLVVANTLPKNAAGNYFGDHKGLFSIHYTVTDLSGNVSEMANRNINVFEDETGLSTIMNIGALMSVYPNPCDGILTMRLASVQKEDVEVVVLDMQGREMMRKTLNGNNLLTGELDLSMVPRGFYLLKVQSGQQFYVKKLEVN